uniref:LRAT domain-containing protein n=1 Tax=Iconisemion striatum TaxID=60296 RepID=A0A1A7WVT1_9TELE
MSFLSSRLAQQSFGTFPDMDENEPEPGDLIEIFCGGYNHWAVYIGEGNVVHFVATAGAAGVSTQPDKDQKGSVRKEKLEEVVGDSKWRINNYLDKEYPPGCKNDIIEKACNRVGSAPTYNLLRYNCEHFATEMRNSMKVSRQVEETKVDLMLMKAAAEAFFGKTLTEN